MNINDRIHGFTVEKKEFLGELDCEVYTLRHNKCGARLTFFDRDDDNKTFSIAFRTTPEDSTGVFHILEHSVLCGSERYPVKDPFVELLKGSLNTFLNAMTFQDKTMYPVSSRNDRDFYNLVGIYLDAVLHPLAVKSPFAFYQEGWHYEIDKENGALDYKGVVLNEMRGDYSSPESVADRHINAMLYPDTCYREDSGGDPEEIVKLTYEEFCAAHKRFYHPTVAEIFLDGRVNLAEILPLIDSYLAEYDRREDYLESVKIDFQKPVSPEIREVSYEISPSESAENKGRAVLGFILGAFSDKERLYAANIIFSSLMTRNESEIKKAILDSGLCEDMLAAIHDGVLEPSFTIEFINIKDGCEDELISLFFDTVASVCNSGIDKKQLLASINSLEFALREKDFGTLPMGVANAMISLETLLYSDDAIGNFRFADVLLSMREKIETDYYESALRAIILDNNRRATLYMRPSSELSSEREARTKARLKEAYEKMTDAERNEIAEMNASLISWQEAADSEQDIAKIPSLSLSDISERAEKIDSSEEEISGVKVITHSVMTRGILYLDLLFDISDVSKEDLPRLFLLNSLLTNLPTENRSASELQALIKTELGALDFRMTALTRDGEGKIYLQVGISALESAKPKIPEILDEIINKTLFEDDAAIKNMLRQSVIASEESFTSAGHQLALGRVNARASAEAAAREYYSGYESYKALKEISKNISASLGTLKSDLKRIASYAFARERLTVFVTGERDFSFAGSLVDSIKKGTECAPVRSVLPLESENEGIIIPAQIGFAARGYNYLALGEEPTGSLDVVRILAGYEFLWGEVRVKGGAYGAGMVAGINGSLGFYSYRDPTPKRSLGCFAEVPDFLRAFANEGRDITKYIIGAVGDAEPIKTARMKGAAETQRYLRGISYEDRCENRRKMLATDRSELLRLATVIERALAEGTVAVVGGREKIDSMRSELDSVSEI